MDIHVQTCRQRLLESQGVASQAQQFPLIKLNPSKLKSIDLHSVTLLARADAIKRYHDATKSLEYFGQS